MAKAIPASQAWLKVSIIGEDTENRIVKGTLFDETPFTIAVRKSHVESANGKEGWINVDYCGQTDKVASIVLPTPIIDKGTRVCVSPADIRLTVLPPK